MHTRRPRRNIPFCRRILAGTVAGKVVGEGTTGWFGRSGSVGRRAVAGRWAVADCPWAVVNGRRRTEDGSKRGGFHMCEKTAQGSRDIPRNLYKGVSITHMSIV